uniref:Uncharacterized protein n=1 Tax=Tanacetum cinerariifolium TaxID=118510 RepID=A0A6L2KIT2_TANCI|nr:hypothetical protein [Tanacetum cinerariifolium]
MLVVRQPAEEGVAEAQVQVDDVVAAAVEENVAEDIAHDAIPSPLPHAILSPSQEPSSPPQQQQKNDNATQKLEIVQLKARVKKLEKANKIKSSKLRRLRKVEASRRVESSDDMEDVFNQGRMIDDMDMNEGIELVKDAEEVVEVVTTGKHITEVVTAAALQVSAASITIPAASATIPAAKPSIPAAAPTVVSVYTKRRKGVIIRDPKEELSLKTPTELQNNPHYIKRYQGMKKRPQTESEARKNMMIYLKNTAGYKMDFFKGMTYAQICPIFQARFDENIRFLFKSREEMEAEDQEIIKSINETPAQKAAKRRKLSEEAQEAKDLRKHLEVVEDEDNDVFVEATPLESKVPVVDYQIVLIDNKPSATKPKDVASTSTAKPVNTARPKQSVNFSNSRISAVKGNRVTTVKASAGCVWRPRVNEIDQISKDNRWIYTRVDYGHPHQALKNKRIVDSGCSRALVTKHHNKTPYELLIGRSSRLHFMRPFGCPVTILNTLDPIGKFKGKADEVFLVGYSITSKAFRVFNTKTRKVEENLHVRFLENKTNVAGTEPNWLFDIDSLKFFMNYMPVFVGNQTDQNAGLHDTNGNVGTQDNVDARKEVSDQHYIMLPLWSSISSTYKSSDDKAENDKPKDDTGLKTVVKPVNKEDQAYRDELGRLMSQEKDASDATGSLSKEFEQGCMDQRGATKAGSTNSFNTVSYLVNAASTSGTFSSCGPSYPHLYAFIPDDMLLHVDQDDSQILDLEDTAEPRSTGIFTSAYDDKLDTFTFLDQSVGAEADFNNMESSTVVDPIPTHRVHIDHSKDQILGDPQSAVQTRGMAKKCSGAHALLKSKKVAQAFDDESWVAAMQDELLIEAIRIFLAFASFMGFIVYQMNIKSDFLYGTIEEEVYVSQPPGFIDSQFLNKVYKVEKNSLWSTPSSQSMVYVDDIIFGSTKKSLCDDFEALMHKRFQMSSMGEITFFLGLQVKKESSLVRIKTQKPLVKDEEAAYVDVNLYRSMIGSLMYLIASRPDIMFAICACSRFQVTLKLSHLHVMKWIFRYLKGQHKLGLWYLKNSPFDLEAYSDSDYVGANLNRKSITGGCQFLSRRLISWQCKKQTIVATSTTKAECVVATNCHGQVLWI